MGRANTPTTRPGARPIHQEIDRPHRCPRWLTEIPGPTHISALWVRSAAAPGTRAALRPQLPPGGHPPSFAVLNARLMHEGSGGASGK